MLITEYDYVWRILAVTDRFRRLDLVFETHRVLSMIHWLQSMSPNSVAVPLSVAACRSAIGTVAVNSGAREDHRRAVREGLVAGFLFLLTGIMATFGLWYSAEMTIADELREELVRIACAASTVVEVELHQSLTDPAMIDGPAYQQAVEPLKRMVKAIPEVRFIYTAVRSGDQVHFILDASEPGDHDGDGVEDRAQLGEVYENPEPAIFDALGSNTIPGRAICTGRNYTDKWGSFVTGYAPFYGSDGRQIGVVGVDVVSDNYMARIRKARARAMLGTMPAILVSLAAALGVYLNRRRMLTTARALKESEKRFRATADAAPALIWTSDAQGNCDWFNRTWLAFTGRALQEEVGSGWLECVHPDDRSTCWDTYRQAIAERRTFVCSYRLRRSDGQYRTVEDWGSPNIDSDGVSHGYVGIAIDISERLEAEQKLVRVAALLETTGQMARIGGWELDLRSNLLVWSTEVYRIFQIDPGTPVTMEQSIAFFSREAQEKLWDAMSAAVREGIPWDLELPFINALGDRMWVRVQGAPEQVKGVVRRLRGAYHDVTQRYDAQLALVEAMRKADAATRAKSEFIANMSHEIRTPLTAIVGYSELLEEDCELMNLPEHRAQTVDTIRQASQHLLTIVNDILDISKIEAGKMTVECVEVDLVSLIASIESLMRPHAIKKGLQLQVIQTTPLPSRVRSDPTRLRQMLMNLVGNAIKFTETGSVTIRVSANAQRDGTLLTVAVEDTGMGLSDDQSRRLFTAFTQSDTSVTRKHGGTGLGLVLCRRMARLLGGDVCITRTSPGEGSVFTVTLLVETILWEEPNPGKVNERPDVSVITPRQLTDVLHGRILLAEDGLDNQRLISLVLRRAGAEVEVADNGQIALQMLTASLDHSPYDLLITDIQMPEMDGYTLTARAREIGVSVPIIALTAHVMAEDRQRCLEAGCNDFAAKPLDKLALVTTCEKWLRISRDSSRLPFSQSRTADLIQ